MGLLNSELRRIAQIWSPLRSSSDSRVQPARRTSRWYGTSRHSPTRRRDVGSAVDRSLGGSAVATRWPHRVAEVIDPRLPDAMDVPWATMAVLVPIPNEGELLFISARPHGASKQNQLESDRLWPWQILMLGTEAPSTIIAGDFNATPEAASIRYLTGLQSIGGRSVHYHDAWPWVEMDLVTPGILTTPTDARRWRRSFVSRTIAAELTTSSSDPGTPTRKPIALLTLQNLLLTSPSTGSGRVTTTASWSILR